MEYEVEEFAPTGRAAQQLSGAGMEISTLQLHLGKGQQADTGEKKLYVIDESSLASSKQMHDFVVVSIRTTALFWSETPGSMKPSKRPTVRAAPGRGHADA